MMFVLPDSEDEFGFVASDIRTTLVSEEPSEYQVLVAVIVAESPNLTEIASELSVSVSEVFAACDGPEDSNPNPKAATTASAIRLKVAFVDISFLSIVATRTFLVAALR
jgi:hypothetical protein